MSDVHEMVLWASRAFLHMMFKDGFFHCDPHPGNLLVDTEGRVGIIDYFSRMRGQMKKIKSFRLPDGLVMWSRAFSLLYGLAAELAPGLRPLDVVGPYILEFMQAGASEARIPA